MCLLFVEIVAPMQPFTFKQGKSVEDIISEWDAELVKRSQSFTEHANALADWDRIILKNRQVLLDVEEHLCQVPFPSLLSSSSWTSRPLQLSGVSLGVSLLCAFSSPAVRQGEWLIVSHQKLSDIRARLAMQQMVNWYTCLLC